jgi:hypothetical protein
MSAPPCLEGTIPPEGPTAVLREIERRCTTGVLRFVAESGSGELAFIRGQLSEAQPGGQELVETWLSLAAGRFELFQRLPALPVSRGDEARREGRLGVHRPADLMNYCEHAGLTGGLFLSQGSRLADFLYDAGELAAVRLFGDEDGEVQQVLAWEEGEFRVEAWSEVPPLPELEEAAPGADELSSLPGAPRTPAGEALLKVVEVTLSSLLDERAPIPKGPPHGEEKGAVDRMAERRAARADATVRVIYLGPPSAGGRSSLPPPPAVPEASEPSSVEVLDSASLMMAEVEAEAPARKVKAPLSGDPTIRTRRPPVSLVSDSTSSGEISHGSAFFREAGPVWTAALAISAILFLAAIAHPFLVK